MASRMAAALEALRAGEISFDEMAGRTRLDWWRLGKYLHARWRLPPSVAAEDVEQELLLGAWEAVGIWDPTRGVTLERFVRWRAMSRGAKWIHNQRRAGKPKGRGWSRYEIPLTCLLSESDEDGARLPEVTVPAEQEGRAVADEIVRLVLADCENEAQRAVACALLLEQGDEWAAAKHLWNDRWARRTLGLKTFERALEHCVRGAEKMRRLAA